MRGKCLVALAALALLQTGTLWAQEDNTNNEETDVSLQEIEVRSIVRRDELQSTSATILENKDIYDRHYITPIDILKRSPGISIRQGGDFGVAQGVMIRGFTGAHDYGGRLLVTVDGIPIHDGGHADGYIDAHIINPLEIESVEIIKGPSSVYYGHHAEGGVAAFQTYKFGDFTRLKLSYDSNNSMDATGVIARQSDKFGQVYSFQIYQTDGWRDHSEAEKQNVSARWSYKFNDKLTATFNVRGFTSDWDSAGSTPSYLPKTAAVDDGSGEYAGGKRKRFDARLWANYMMTDESQFTFYAYGVDMTNSRFSKSWAWNRQYGDANGNDQSNHHKALGTGLMYNYKGEWGGRDASATLGIDYVRENELREQWGLTWGQGRAHRPNSKTMDHEYTIDTLSLLGEVNYQVLDPLKARLGLRYDRFSGDIDTGSGQGGDLGPNRHYDAKSRSVFSPKAGLVYTTPVEWLELYANYGRGFGLPYMETGDFFINPNSKITKRDQYELGFRAAPADWIDFNSVVYILNTDQDITWNPDTEKNENSGKTQRTGIETVVNIYPWKDWTFSGNYTYQTAKYKSHANGTYNLSGRRMTRVPRHITNLELAYAPEEGLGGRLSFNWNADALANDNPPVKLDGTLNTAPPMKTQDYGSLDLQLSYKFNEHYRLVMDATNLLNKDYTSSGAYSWVTNDPSHPEGYYVTGWMKPLTVYFGLEMVF